MKYTLNSLLVAAFVTVTFSASALNPTKEYAVKPEKYGMTYKEERIATKDGAMLNAWFFELPTKTTNWMVISGWEFPLRRMECHHVRLPRFWCIERIPDRSGHLYLSAIPERPERRTGPPS
jgi:hypothetical protein